MPQLTTKKMIRLHVGYYYALLDVTPENLALAVKLSELDSFTTNYTKDHGSTMHPTGDMIADTIEITEIKISDLSSKAFDAAIAAAQVEPELQAAE